MRITLLCSLLVFSLSLTFCGEQQTDDPETVTPQEETANTANKNESLEIQVTQLIDQNEYERALELLRQSDEEPQRVEELKAGTHLAYAHYLTNEADHMEMGKRMPDALRHFRRVLELDEGNTMAQNYIDRIESIYEQMGRDIPEGVAE